MMKTLILGGARSGKSRLAEQLATDSKLPVIYVATASPDDDEMRHRIVKHRQQRPHEWRVIENKLELDRILQQHASDQHCLLVDCLTLWLSNHLSAGSDPAMISERLLNVVKELPGRIIFVSNETGLGIVPMGELSRRFVDESGCLHQALAQLCNQVILTVAGLPFVLKGDPL
jgi:adenosylcobinamide kinase/adenosylcobinamide-phosphate guanylyltransferase